MSYADEFGYVESLNISFLKSLSVGATIFANGENQVPVLIEAVIAKKDNSGYFIFDSVDDFYATALPTLVNFKTGNNNVGPTSDWKISTYGNDYSDPIRYTIDRASPLRIAPMDASDLLIADAVTRTAISDDGKTNQMVVYISCVKGGSEEVFSLQISTPYGVINTTSNGTSTPNGNNGTFNAPKYVQVAAVEPIDYKNKANLTLEGMPPTGQNGGLSGLTTIVSDVAIKWNDGIRYEVYYNASGNYGEVRIYPKENALKFTYIHVSRRRIKPNGMKPQSSNGWDYDAVLMRNNVGATDLVTIQVNQDFVGLMAGSYIDYDLTNILIHQHYTYWIGPNDSRLSRTFDQRAGCINVALFVHRIPYGDLNFSQGKPGYNPYNDYACEVNVTDNFGNKSSLILTLNSSAVPGFDIL